MKKLSCKVSRLTLACLAASSISNVWAQEESAIEEIVVTGTATARTSFDTPLSITSFGEKELERLSSNSQADILRAVPGINAEGGGGEVASNVRVTGLPSGGQYAFTPIQYDGIPNFSTFGLNSSAVDVYVRNDLGISRLEFVRGGVSNLFGAGSVAGIINYISKKGSDNPEHTIQFEVAEEGRQRLDFASSGPLSSNSNTYYAISGYYRQDDGPLESGLDTEGGQIRANIKHEFSDGSGSFTVGTQLIDDEVQFFLPYPLNASDLSRPTGNDGREIFTLQTAQAANLSFPIPGGGVYNSAISDGVSTQGGNITFALEKDISDSLTFNTKLKYADYDHEFNLFLDGDGVTNVPLTPEAYLDAVGAGTVGVNDLQNASFTFVDDGSSVGSDDLLFGNRILDRDRPAEDLTGEFSLTYKIETGNLTHNITGGIFLSDAEAKDVDYIYAYLTDFVDQPRLVNVTSNGTVIANGGLTNTNGQISDQEISATRQAFYLANQIEAERWSFDIGLRIENIDADISRPSFSRVDIGAPANFADNLRTAGAADGGGLFGSVEETATAVAIAGIYRLNDELNFFYNASDGFFFPQLRSAQFGQDGNPLDYEAEEIFRAQAGFKYSGERLRGSASILYVELDNRQEIDQVNGPDGSVIDNVNITATETTAFEIEGSYLISDALSISGNLSYQDPEFTQFDGAPQNIGNEPNRNPKFAWNLGITYDDGVYDASLFNTHTGDAFTNDANTTELDAFDITNLTAGYTFSMANDSTVRLGISVFNLFDEEGITEGSPRVGNVQTNTGDFFVGRPILPRRVSFKARWDF